MDESQFEEVAAVGSDAEATDKRRYDSLADALRQSKATLANQSFLSKLLGAIDIKDYYERAGYIRAVRRDGGPDIRIAFGYSNGFRSSAEIRDVLEDAEVWRSQRTAGGWGVTHPDNKMRGGDGGYSTRQKKDGDTCAICGMVMPLSGICDEQH